MNKIAIIIGGWYFPKHLYDNVIQLLAPTNYSLEFFVMSHRNPDLTDISKEMLTRAESNNIFDHKLYSEIASYDHLNNLGYKVHECANAIGDYYFFNQWADLYDYKQYDYVVFMHDDNFILPNFKNLLTDLFENKLNLFKFNKSWVSTTKFDNFDYIANSPVGNRKTARGSFSIWSRNLLQSMNGIFPMNDVKLDRTNLNDTPYGHEQLADWNMVGRNFQDHVEANGFMRSTYRLSNVYRISKYLIEAERGLIGHVKVNAHEFVQELKKITI